MNPRNPMALSLRCFPRAFTNYPRAPTTQGEGGEAIRPDGARAVREVGLGYTETGRSAVRRPVRQAPMPKAPPQGAKVWSPRPLGRGPVEDPETIYKIKKALNRHGRS